MHAHLGRPPRNGAVDSRIGTTSPHIRMFGHHGAVVDRLMSRIEFGFLLATSCLQTGSRLLWLIGMIPGLSTRMTGTKANTAGSNSSTSPNASLSAKNQQSSSHVPEDPPYRLYAVGVKRRCSGRSAPVLRMSASCFLVLLRPSAVLLQALPCVPCVVGVHVHVESHRTRCSLPKEDAACFCDISKGHCETHLLCHVVALGRCCVNPRSTRGEVISF